MGRSPAPDPPDRGRGDARGGLRRWLLAGGVITLVAVVVLAGWRLVGGGDLERVARAPDATTRAGTARVAVDVTVEGVPVVGPFTLVVAEGEVDFTEQEARLRREVPGAAAIPLLDELSEPMELLHDGGVSYLRLPLRGEQAWMVVGEPGDPAGGGQLTPGLSNPAAALALLRVLEGMPEPLGEELVRGQPSTRFRVQVDLRRAADALSGRAAAVAQGLRRLRGRDDLPIDVWIDEADRVTRLRYAVEPEVAGTRITVVSDLELWDFGTPVDITAPTPAELVPAPADVLRRVDPLGLLRALLGR